MSPSAYAANAWLPVRSQLLNAASERCGRAKSRRWPSAPDGRGRLLSHTVTAGQAGGGRGARRIIQRVEATDCVKQKKTCDDHALLSLWDTRQITIR